MSIRNSVETIELTNYRNFKNITIEAGTEPVIIEGRNGAGKTNILESISLLFPGKGLRSAKLAQINHLPCSLMSSTNLYDSIWRVEANINGNLGRSKIVTSFDKNFDSNPRNVLFNGSKISSSELARISSIMWLTPQMDYLFIAPAADRRKFFDRIVYNFDSEHSKAIYKYEYYIRERLAILHSGSDDENWLNVLEHKIAEITSAIIFNRSKVLDYLQDSIDNFESAFPKAALSLEGEAEELIKSNNALEFENIIRERFYYNRGIDKDTKRTNFGPHKTDFIAYFHNGAHASLCSTGEQKSLLISIILAEINAKFKWTSTLPIVLLDEINVHLDDSRRKNLLNHLVDNGLQFWITTTDIDSIYDTYGCKIIHL